MVERPSLPAPLSSNLSHFVISLLPWLSQHRPTSHKHASQTRRDTEAGRMLNKLYAGQSKPTINYPAVRTRKQTAKPRFIPGGGNSDIDSRRK